MLPGDFMAAFPSVIHRWIWLVLKFRKLPASFITLFKCMYHGASASITHAGVKYKIIDFFSGVLQGCPASAALFDNAIGPSLFDFNKRLENDQI